MYRAVKQPGKLHSGRQDKAFSRMVFLPEQRPQLHGLSAKAGAGRGVIFFVDQRDTHNPGLRLSAADLLLLLTLPSAARGVPAVPTRPFVVPKAAAGSSSPCSGRSWTCGASRGGCPRSSSRVCPPAAGAPTKTAALRGARTGRAAAGSVGHRPGPREVTASPARLRGSWAHLSRFRPPVLIKPSTRVPRMSRTCLSACRRT